MKLNPRPKIFLVYGNHGPSPHQLEDYFDYFGQIANTLEFDLLLSHDPRPGFVNILIECFSPTYVPKILACKKHPGTRFIAVATEFITGDTFNYFDAGKAVFVPREAKKAIPLPVRRFVDFSMSIFFPAILRDVLSVRFPGIYLKGKEAFLKRFAVPKQSYYENKAYWAGRFKSFNSVVKVSDVIWCVTPHQLQGYKNHFPKHSVELLPMVSWSPLVTNPLQGELEKDIDFLFTGSLTPYRKVFLDSLSDKGYNVVVGNATWPSQIRENFTARAKVCLHIKQDAEWQYPSIMRYHYLLCSGSVVLAESSTERCMQEDYITVADSREFIKKCEELLASPDHLKLGFEHSQKYYEGSATGRQMTQALFLPFLLNGGKTSAVAPSLSHS